MKKHLTIALLIASATLLTACEPKVGSDEWCKAMDKKEAGDMTLNDSKAYIKHCVMNIKEDK